MEQNYLFIPCLSMNRGGKGWGMQVVGR